MRTSRLSSLLVSLSLLVAAGCAQSPEPTPEELAAVRAPTLPEVVARGDVEALVGEAGIDGDFIVRGSSSTMTSGWADGRWTLVEALYADDELATEVSAPDGYAAADAVAVEGSDGGVLVEPRPTTLLDEVVGCVRVVVNGDGFDAPDEAAVDAFVAEVTAALDAWAATQPADPCDARAAIAG